MYSTTTKAIRGLKSSLMKMKIKRIGFTLFRPEAFPFRSENNYLSKAENFIQTIIHPLKSNTSSI